jgi:ligand-binding SRPBCC domain-containing protein
MNYRHRFVVRAPLEKVSEFHSQAASMPAITPPPLSVRLNACPENLGEGDEMDFSLGVGPLRIRWVARIERVSLNGFTDRQMRGPFAEWVHRHSFIEVDSQSTAVIDEITLRLRRNPFWWLVGMAMWAGLPILFAFRGYQTRRMLQ